MEGSFATPEKVKALLSSFLVRPKHSDSIDEVGISPQENRNTEESPNNVDSSKKSVSKKRRAVESDTPSKISKNLRSYASFIQRLDTFSSLSWFGKPTELDPPRCARYGWENTDTDVLHCVSCQAYLSGKLPPKVELEAYKAASNNLIEKLTGAHDKFCPLVVNPCPESFSMVSVEDPSALLDQFGDRLKSLSKVQDNLPSLDLSSLEQFGYDEGQADAYYKRRVSPESEASPQLITLSITGWSCRLSNKDVLWCSMCRRMVGLWNFVRDTDSEDADQITQEEEKDEDSTPDAKRRKIMMCKKAKLNPFSEHHLWCPWLQLRKDTSTPTNNSDTSSTEASRDSHREFPACVVALKFIMPGLIDNNAGLAHAMKTSPVIDSLRCFRQVVNGWSSRKHLPPSNAQP